LSERLKPYCCWFCRVESLNMKSKAGVAKIIGTLTSFAGVMILTLYKGVPLTHQVESSSSSVSSSDHHHAEPSKKNWTLGTVALLANCLCFSFWLLLQSKLTKKYPALYSSTAYMFLISSVQGGGLTVAIQRRTSVWVLKKPVEIAAVLYTVRWFHRSCCHFFWYLYVFFMLINPLFAN
jgi:drug/metabolite transporter (DMT)-like permease